MKIKLVFRHKTKEFTIKHFSPSEGRWIESKKPLMMWVEAILEYGTYHVVIHGNDTPFPLKRFMLNQPEFNALTSQMTRKFGYELLDMYMFE